MLGREPPWYLHVYFLIILPVIISITANSICCLIYVLWIGNLVLGNRFCWEERYKIALGVAEALNSLHNTAETIIHRDVKSSNILLSDDFEPQVPCNL